MPTGMLTQANAWASSLQLKSLFFILIVLISLIQRVDIVPLLIQVNDNNLSASGITNPLLLGCPDKGHLPPMVGDLGLLQ